MQFSVPQRRQGKARGFRRSGVVMAVTSLLLAVFGATAAPAQASVEECWDGYFCFWVDGGFSPGSAMGLRNADTPNLGVYSNALCKSGTWNDCISSFYNNTDRIVVLFENENYNNYGGGPLAGSVTIRPGWGYDVMPWWTGSDGRSASSNDKVTSIDFR